MGISSSLRKLFRQRPNLHEESREGSDEQVIRRSEELLHLALRGANAGAWVIDVEGGNTHWNEQLDHLYGFELSQSPSFQRWVDRLHPDDRQWAVANLDARLHSDTVEFEREFRIIHPQKGVRWILNKGSIERDEKDKPVRVYGIDMDITERKEAQKKLEEADQRKDEFLAILAHELRNPLTPLRTSLDILRIGREDPVIAEQALERMDHQLQHMVVMIDDLLDTSRVRHGKLLLRRERLRIADVIAQAVEASEDFIRERQNELIIGPIPDNVYVEADIVRLVQVLANLLNNAAKFTGPAGLIWLSVQAEREQVLISVKDNGIGIAGEKFQSLFGMFSQVAPPIERSFGGLGIGLSLARGLVELHGGKMNAYSEGLGQGAEFTVNLPRVGPPSQKESQRETGEPEFARGLRILVVDDNRESAISMATLLELTGNETRKAFDGQTGLQMAEDFRPEVVLLDIGMPVLNGYEVARRIRSQAWGRDVLLVAVSGWGQEEDRKRSSEAGFDHHLVKPVDFAAVQRVLEDPKRQVRH
jgi:PAS domain S-box-containing protein